MFWTNKNKLIYSLSESVTLVTSLANWFVRRETVVVGSLSRFFQHAWMVLVELDILSSLLPHDSGLWPQTSCLTTAFLKLCLHCLAVFYLYASVHKRVHRSCMPRKRHEKTFETLLQTKERLTRELRLRTEKRIKELLESEQLTVTEDEAVSYDTDPQELHTGRPRVAVPSQVTLILVACFLWISVVAYLNWFNRNHTCYRI